MDFVQPISGNFSPLNVSAESIFLVKLSEAYDGCTASIRAFAIAPIFAPDDEPRRALSIIDYILVDPFEMLHAMEKGHLISLLSALTQIFMRPLCLSRTLKGRVCMWTVLVPHAINGLKGDRQ